MSKMLTYCLLIGLCVAFPASAEMFKCKQSDGSISFQEDPCQRGAASLPPPSNNLSVNAPNKQMQGSRSLQSANASSKGAQGSDEFKKQQERVKAEEAARRCSSARRNLEVLKVERPVYSYDSNGKQKFVPDSARKSEIEAASQRVAEECE